MRRNLCRGAVIAAGLLAGVLLCSGLLVAPLVFQTLPDDHVLAGRIAGQIFRASYWVAFGVSLVLLALYAVKPQPSGEHPRRIDVGTTLLLLLAVLQLFVIAPAIAAHGVGWPFSFASLHGTASAVHVLMVALAICCAWRWIRICESIAQP